MTASNVTSQARQPYISLVVHGRCDCMSIVQYTLLMLHEGTAAMVSHPHQAAYHQQMHHLHVHSGNRGFPF